MSLASRLLALTQRIANELKAVRNRLVITRAATDGITAIGEEPLDVSIVDDYGYLVRLRNGTGMEVKLELTDDNGARFVVGADGANQHYLEFYGLDALNAVKALVGVGFTTDSFDVRNPAQTALSTFNKAKATMQPSDVDDLTRKDYVDLVGGQALQTSYLFRVFTDCIANVNTPDFTHAVSGTGAAFSALAAGVVSSRAYGVLGVALGTTAAGRAAIHSPNLSVVNFLDVVGRKWTSSARVTCKVVSDSTNRYSLRAGFLDSVTGEPVDGCYWRYTDNVNGGNWQCVARSNNAETATNTTNNFVANDNSEYSVTVEDVSGTRTAKFWRRAFGGAAILVATITNNVPFGTNRDTGYGVAVIRSLGTAAVSPIEIDTVECKCEVATTGAWR